MTSCGGGWGLFVGVWKCRFKGPRWAHGGSGSLWGAELAVPVPQPREAPLGARAHGERGADDSALPRPWRRRAC